MKSNYRIVIGPLIGMAFASVVVLLFPNTVLYFITAIVMLFVLFGMYNESRK